MSGSFLQTKNWAEFQRSLKRPIFEYDKEGIKAYVFRHNIPFRKNYLYIPHGPIIDFNSMVGGIKNPIKNYFKWLKDLGKSEKSIFIKTEPLYDSVAQVLMENGFKKSKKEIQSSKTIIIDLRQDLSKLKTGMHHKTRYNIKVAQKYGLKFRILEPQDFDFTWEIFEKTAKRDKFHLSNEDYYEKLLNFNFEEFKVFLGGIFKGNALIAAGIFLTHKDTGYYLHGASDYEYRKYMAPYLLHWQIIENFKNEGLIRYDMWGINANKWPGVTKFKLGWGGNVSESPGAFDLTANKFWHFTYNIFQKIRRK